MAALFTTTVEIPDERMGLSQSRVLAAVGTTLPKTIIPVTALSWVRRSPGEIRSWRLK
jgi:hypothetical protein